MENLWIQEYKPPLPLPRQQQRAPQQPQRQQQQQPPLIKVPAWKVGVTSGRDVIRSSPSSKFTIDFSKENV